MPMGTWPGTPGAKHSLIWPCGPDNSVTTEHAWFHMAVSDVDSAAAGWIWLLGVDDSGDQREPVELGSFGWELRANTPETWECPDNTAYIVVRVDAANSEIDWALELQASPS